MLPAFRNWCYRLLETGITGFQKPGTEFHSWGTGYEDI